MDRAWRRGLITGAVIALALAAVAVRARDRGPADTSAGGGAADERFPDAGSPIAEGLTVPEGTR